jgi:uncharacterized DUF497 family protein
MGRVEEPFELPQAWNLVRRGADRLVRSDDHATEFHDPEHSATEERFLRVGYSTRGRILLVIFCEKHGGSVVRIISARKATSKEKKTHEEGI